jgi:hypothetical protein
MSEVMPEKVGIYAWLFLLKLTLMVGGGGLYRWQDVIRTNYHRWAVPPYLAANPSPAPAL